MIRQNKSITVQGNLSINYDSKTYDLFVKTILLKGIYYFFIHDAEKNHSLLSRETLELVYMDGFDVMEKEAGLKNKKISPEIVNLVQDMLVKKKDLWHYSPEPN